MRAIRVYILCICKSAPHDVLDTVNLNWPILCTHTFWTLAYFGFYVLQLAIYAGPKLMGNPTIWCGMLFRVTDLCRRRWQVISQLQFMRLICMSLPQWGHWSFDKKPQMEIQNSEGFTLCTCGYFVAILVNIEIIFTYIDGNNRICKANV